MANDPSPQNGAAAADGPAPVASHEPPATRHAAPADPRKAPDTRHAAPADPRAAPGASPSHADALYTARVHNHGGTAGEVVIEGAAAVELGARTAGHAGPTGPDGALALPTGGPSAAATGFNPEQLLAAAWSTCLGETLKVVLVEHGHRAESRVSVEVELHRDPAGGYRFAPRALVEIDGVPAAEATALIESAHARCPVSKLLAGRGEATVTHRITH